MSLSFHLLLTTFPAAISYKCLPGSAGLTICTHAYEQICRPPGQEVVFWSSRGCAHESWLAKWYCLLTFYCNIRELRWWLCGLCGGFFDSAPTLAVGYSPSSWRKNLNLTRWRMSSHRGRSVSESGLNGRSWALESFQSNEATLKKRAGSLNEEITACMFIAVNYYRYIHLCLPEYSIKHTEQ